MSARKQYDDDFKIAAVKRMKSEKAQEICKDLKIRESMIYHWRKKFAKEAGITLRGHKASTIELEKSEGNVNIKDAIIYLKHAQKAMNVEIRTGVTKKLSRSNLLALLALETLTGE